MESGRDQALVVGADGKARAADVFDRSPNDGADRLSERNSHAIGGIAGSQHAEAAGGTIDDRRAWRVTVACLAGHGDLLMHTAFGGQAAVARRGDGSITLR